MPHNEYIRKQQAENMQEIRDMEVVIDWSKQAELPEQIAALRRLYGIMRQEMEKAPGGGQGLARGVMLLACNVLHSGAETIEDHYADKLGERK